MRMGRKIGDNTLKDIRVVEEVCLESKNIRQGLKNEKDRKKQKIFGNEKYSGTAGNCYTCNQQGHKVVDCTYGDTRGILLQQRQ